MVRDIYISQSLSPESFMIPPWPWKQQIRSAIPSILRRMICQVCLGQETTLIRLLNTWILGKQFAEYFFFFPSQTYIKLHTTDGAILPDKKGEKRKLTMPELHAVDEIRSSNNMHIQPQTANKRLQTSWLVCCDDQNPNLIEVIHQKLKLKLTE
jgi:hypothetical protein